jgi:hypothetical protein
MLLRVLQHRSEGSRHACEYKLANAHQDTRAIQLYLGPRNMQHTVKSCAHVPHTPALAPFDDLGVLQTRRWPPPRLGCAPRLPWRGGSYHALVVD